MANDLFAVRAGMPLRGEITVPGDKSMSHRAVMFGALAQGETHVRAWLPAGDTEASLAAIRALGVRVDRHSDTELTIHGGQLHKPERPLDLVNAGTGIRLLTGIMVGQPFSCVLDGSDQLRRRPMKRIIDPLRLMGADIEGTNGYAPLYVRPAKLKGVKHKMTVASAQVKSAILLAALFAEGLTCVIEAGPSRDHTERMLSAMGVEIETVSNVVVIEPMPVLKPIDFTIPGDASSAAFPVVAALITPGSDITLTNINLNPTRTGLFDVLKQMEADLTITVTGTEAGDPVGTIRAKYSQLKGTKVGGDVVVRMIDEFPILMVAALFAEGETRARDAGELRVKETDRLAVMTAELKKMGADIVETEDGFFLKGPQYLAGTDVYGHDDHRISMSLAVAGMAADGDTRVIDAECAADSFPGFAETFQRLGADIQVQPWSGEA